MKPDSADDVLQSYLDALLLPADAPPGRPFAEPAPSRLRALPPVAPAPVVAVAPAAVEPVVEVKPADVAKRIAEAAPAVKAAPVAETAPALASAPQAPSIIEPDGSAADALAPADWAGNGRPQWAQERFEALLFSVGGLNLAVPLVELGSVHPLEAGVMTPLFGQADWFLGLLPGKAGNIRVVDSARVVMPERYDAALAGAYRYVITLNGSDWGLAVDAISDAVRLDPEQVRWRGARGKRPWLAGTVVDHMCALLDVAQLTWMFHRADRRRGGGRGRRHGDC